MAHITDLVAPHFTGHVGPVRFVNGHAETDDPDLVAFFDGDPDRYRVDATDEPAADELDDEKLQITRGVRDDQDDDTQE